MRGKLLAFLMVCLAVSIFSVTNLAQTAGQKNVIIYGSRYGSTAQSANWIAEGMEGKVDVIAASDVGDLTSYDFIILGSGIYMGQLHQDILAFLETNKEAIKEKIVALFVVCGSPASNAQRYLDMFAEKCGVKPSLMRAFGGWQKKELLSPEDYKTLEDFYKRINRPFENYDHTEKSNCLQFGKEILEAISSPLKK